jgi:DNA-directed RNA polymerase specialized sigma24 family protein
VKAKDKTAPTVGTIAEADFDAIVAAHGIIGPKTIKALRLHFVAGKTRAEAAARAGINASAITRAAHRFTRPVCPTCGQEIPEK